MPATRRVGERASQAMFPRGNSPMSFPQREDGDGATRKRALVRGRADRQCGWQRACRRDTWRAAQPRCGRRQCHMRRRGRRWPNGAAIGADGRCYICNNGGFAEIVIDGCVFRTKLRSILLRGRSRRSISQPVRSDALRTHRRDTGLGGRTISYSTPRAAFGSPISGATGGACARAVRSIMHGRTGAKIREVIAPTVPGLKLAF